MENGQFKKTFIVILTTSIAVSSVFGAVMGFYAGSIAGTDLNLGQWFQGMMLGRTSDQTGTLSGGGSQTKVVTVDQESSIIQAVEKVSPAVVSIIVTKDLPIIERYYSEPFGGSDFFRQFFGDDFSDFFGQPQYRQKGTQKQEVGGGSGFIVSADGYIITNKHVVADEEADYTVLMNDESKHEANVLARDPINDVAILKIEGKDLPYVEFGDSANLKVGQTVIAIGNALGEFRNTVSTGVISGLARSVMAGGTGMGSEQLTGVIQTDASINPGNSGGPLLNIAGQVIGINTAMAQGAENIGFTIPVNEVKSSYESVKATGKIVRPWLGIRYVLINEEIKEANKLDTDHGALIVRGESMTDLAVIPGSPADKAGLKENDIILEINGVKIDDQHPLANAIRNYKIGEEVTLKILRQGKEETVKVKLEEMK
ncbi:MAG: trypsin-like peptidase domain-containing protein [Planctomycetes bacterium]|jgi:serine protease Do|nr:trypsin-like peptidase domain-containing protein [Planctomycetota bacterium]